MRTRLDGIDDGEPILRRADRPPARDARCAEYGVTSQCTGCARVAHRWRQEPLLICRHGADAQCIESQGPGLHPEEVVDDLSPDRKVRIGGPARLRRKRSRPDPRTAKRLPNGHPCKVS